METIFKCEKCGQRTLYRVLGRKNIILKDKTYKTTFCTCPICTALKEKMATNPTGEKDISLRLIDTIAALNEAILG